jgi:esterase/lipase superfamily enzyme
MDSTTCDIQYSYLARCRLNVLNQFVGDYSDENVYLNSPLAFLSNLDDPWYLEQFRKSQIIIAAGQGAWEDEMLQETLALKSVLEAKEIPAWVDIWGNDVNHDWPWWRKMLPYFLGEISLA